MKQDIEKISSGVIKAIFLITRTVDFRKKVCAYKGKKMNKNFIHFRMQLHKLSAKVKLAFFFSFEPYNLK